MSSTDTQTSSPPSPKVSIDVRNEVIEVPGARVEKICAPTSVEEVAEVVSAAANDKFGLLIAGGRTRLGVANPARSIGLTLSLTSLSGIDEFEPDEGVLHAKAGTRLSEIRETVQREGWELPLDSPGSGSTVGGTVASAVTGPRAQAFGSVSDAILGLEVVAGDGVASKCGGRVVKNVTGYDLAKLYCGSFGSLAIVTGAWLRLRPAAEVREAYCAELPNDRECFEQVRSWAALTSVRALVWTESPHSQTAKLVLEFGGSAEGVRHDVAQVSSVVPIEPADPDEIDPLRDARAEAVSEEDSVALRVRVLGSRSEGMRRTLISKGLRVSVDAGLGVIHARGSLGSPNVLALLREEAEAAGGFATFEQMPVDWRGELDAFGSLGGVEAIVATLKAKMDPEHILNPGRFAADSVEGESR